MADLIWTHDTLPDRPGIWLRRSKHGHVSAISIVGDNHGYPRGTYCFHSDWPDVKEPPRYRDVTAADVNQLIEVEGRTENCFFVGFSLNGCVVFESQGTVLYETPKRCRILDSGDDGEPKREAREWWVLQSNNNPKLAYIYSDKAEAVEGQGHSWSTIHVREVID